MLVLKVKLHEKVILADQRTGELLAVVSIEEQFLHEPLPSLRLGFTAPDHVKILRGGLSNDKRAAIEATRGQSRLPSRNMAGVAGPGSRTIPDPPFVPCLRPSSEIRA